MTRMLFAIAGALALTACGSGQDGYSPSPGSDSGEGSAAAETAQQLPFGFRLFPDARVLNSFQQGLTVTIASDASQQEIAEFYESELERLGWSEVSQRGGEESATIMLEGRDPTRPGKVLGVGITRSGEGADQTALSFIESDVPVAPEPPPEEPLDPLAEG
ncbi:hypothetical protein I5L01_07350 [Erythrobacter sp. YJ-T3-07]|uniref:hypothetical protein n=1 Tax=Erythrobacter sp. YJ-T3-07 TaxID=2793063 RepID=UPI0018D3A83A|nr:hypothetical protein [Erythrobacter sp. YJ-T3-07]MBH1944048.1 hypothetical protein [Erythrobacter sp. YJ-T3-07]